MGATWGKVGKLPTPAEKEREHVIVPRRVYLRFTCVYIIFIHTNIVITEFKVCQCVEIEPALGPFFSKIMGLDFWCPVVQLTFFFGVYISIPSSLDLKLPIEVTQISIILFIMMSVSSNPFTVMRPRDLNSSWNEETAPFLGLEKKTAWVCFVSLQ